MPELFLARYEVMRPLASGGMGSVSLARDLESNALVVVKTALDGDPTTLFDEARVVAQLRHPNIAAVLDAGQSQGKPFAVFELVDGASLSQLVKHMPDRRLPVEHAAFVMHQVLGALAYAHAAVDDAGAPLGIVHRDVSPQNIMVARDSGAVKLIDFGIARGTVRESRTSTGVIKGKLRYLAPEQARGLRVDGRCDQFAAGVVLWELLTGVPRLTEREELAALQHASATPLERASVHRAIPRSLDDAIARMTALEPSERFATCADAAKA
ncbi:MAG TPA: serine/threonine-protein kinase, partial [Myxococcota bacterium]